MRTKIGCGTFANGIKTEDECSWVYGVGVDGIMAFTDFAIENLKHFVKMHKADPDLLKRPK